MAQAADPDIVLADFEGKDYGDWKTAGEAFGPGPAQGTLPHQMEVSGYLGHGLVNSFHGGDKSTGTLTSPEFKMERKFITFLIGGGAALPGTAAGSGSVSMTRLVTAGQTRRLQTAPQSGT